MCYSTQFVLSNITIETHAKHLARLFTENAILSFVMVEILVVDPDSQFKIVLKDICAALRIIYWPFLGGNHKGVSIKKYHRFLNKMQVLAGQDIGTHAVFLHYAKTPEYTWNIALIDGTYIPRSDAAVGR